MRGLNTAFCRAVLKSKTDFYDSFIAFKTQDKQNLTGQSLQVSNDQLLWTCAGFSQLSTDIPENLSGECSKRYEVLEVQNQVM